MNKGITFAKLALTALLSLTLLGCNDDGNNVVVEEGERIIVPVVDSAERALVIIDKVVENPDHTVTIHFSATNENDIALIGLSEPRFTLAKLVPEQDGKASEWVSFINKAAAPDPETGTLLEETVLQATYDRDSKNEEGRFSDNGNGTYTFKLKETVLVAINPITNESIAWDPMATHRVGMQISANSNNTVNATYDWVPAGGEVVDIRNMVDTDTCNSCHGELKLHGSRVEVKYCATCHNPGSTDPESGNTVDFTPMIHKIHRGKDLPSMAAKGDGAIYEIVGYRGTPHTYAENVDGDITGVALPQDIRNCSNCHTSENEATPQGDNWTSNASVVACTSCHDDIAFSQEELDNDLDALDQPWKRAHPNGFVEADSCTSCHGDNSGNTSPAYAHETVLKQAKSAADNLTISIERVARIASDIEVDLQIELDGKGIPNFEALVGPVNLIQDPTTLEYSYSYPDSKLVSNKGYLLVNYDKGNGYELSYGAIQNHLEPIYDAAGNKIETCVPKGSGLFTCTVTAPGTTGVLSLVTTEMPLCANGKSAGGDLIACNTLEDSYTQREVVPANNVKGFYNLTADDGPLSEASDYVEKVGADMALCANCHGGANDPTDNGDGFHMTRHGATDLAECKNCHNATRSSYYGGRPADLKSHVHTLHASNDSSHPLEAYPNNVATCTSCHTDTQYDLNPDTLMNTRSSAGGGVYTSPTVTVCASCHIKDVPVGFINSDLSLTADTVVWGNVSAGGLTRQAALSDDDQAANTKWIAHMQKYGGAFGQPDMDTADAAPELCADCHAKGEVKGVDTVHGL